MVNFDKFWGLKCVLKFLMLVISDVWRIGTNSSYMWRIGTNSSYIWRILENIATTNHPLPLIPVEQLSADGERIFTKYWLTASGMLVQEQCG